MTSSDTIPNSVPIGSGISRPTIEMATGTGCPAFKLRVIKSIASGNWFENKVVFLFDFRFSQKSHHPKDGFENRIKLLIVFLVINFGGLAIGCGISDGPYRKPGTTLDPSITWTLFTDPPFRGAAMGYWGHMWEVRIFL